ncbi:MAG: HAD-IA family hydrolase [bacterium]
MAFDLYGTLLDVRSLDRVCAEAAGSADVVTAWRQKQLEYTWLRAAMGRYEDFWTVTAESLDYTLERLGLSVEPDARRRMLDGWLSPERLGFAPDVVVRDLAELAERVNEAERNR